MSVNAGLRLCTWAALVNALLATFKIAGGVFGHSYVLIADGIESIADVFSSIVVWSALRVSAMPADENHPYGHGKAEPIAAVVVSCALLGAAILIAVQSVREILEPSQGPSWFTLPLLVIVVVVKGWLSRLAFRMGANLDSTALKSDAWHHRSDALTSVAALVGIAIALIGGPGYESADDWAALVACGVIAWNGTRLMRDALNEVMDASVSVEVVSAVRSIAATVEGVIAIDKCRVRKAGLHLVLDIHVVVDGGLSVRRGHDIAHAVKDCLLQSPYRINDVTVHIEPARETEIREGISGDGLRRGG